MMKSLGDAITERAYSQETESLKQEAQCIKYWELINTEGKWLQFLPQLQ